ncbi:MAG: hypothetical protein LQ345_001142 [Seirophora villosa]|nr:MAG: hypothetical protein LQ345_001142 [Seirophora villosa]
MADALLGPVTASFEVAAASQPTVPIQPSPSSPHNRMNIRHPPRPSPNNPIILYLPSGLPARLPIRQPPTNPLHTLALSANATVVHIDYRLSAQTPYPKPIHDLLASYDWILAHLLPSSSSNPAPNIGVCGEHAGGSLAATLALTECHAHKPGGITAAALGNPVVDWTSPFKPPHTTTKNHTTNDNSPNRPDSSLTKNLAALRARSFAQPQHQHDPFASPLLFFRTPAHDLSPSPSSSSSSSSQNELPAGDNNDEDNDAIPPPPKRLSHRKYPPVEALHLRLPRTRILLGETHPLREQGLEFARLMRRSVELYGGGGSEGQAEERVQVMRREGDGMWGEREVGETGAWLGEVLRMKK